MSNIPDNVTDPNRTFQAFGAARRLWSGRDEEILIEGPAGTGKTRAILEKAHFCAMRYPKARILLVRKTRESMTESVLVTYEEEVLPEQWVSVPDTARNIRQLYRYPEGSVIVIGGMDKASKIMSTQYDLICCFETTEFTENDIEALTTRLRNGRMPYQQLIADCNPDVPAHWLNRRASKGLMKRLKSRHQDNPVLYDHKADKWTDRGEVYRKRLNRLTGARRKRLFLGLWSAAEGMVYPDYDYDVHVINRFRPKKHWRKWIAVDFGFKHPFVAQWWCLDGDGVAIMYREIYFTERLVSDHAEKIKLLSDGERIEACVCDWDAEGRATLEAAGIPTIPAYKEKLRGIEAVQLRMRTTKGVKPTLKFMRDCLVETDQLRDESGLPVRTTDEIPGYIWDKDKKTGQTIREETIRENDDGCDAMRYAIGYIDNLASTRLDVETDEPASVRDDEDLEAVPSLPQKRLRRSGVIQPLNDPSNDDVIDDDEDDEDILEDGPSAVFV